jgi:hypothetical protein
MIRTPFNISILAELAITLAAASFVQADDATVAAYLDNFVAHPDEVAERRTVDPTCPHQIECN